MTRAARWLVCLVALLSFAGCDKLLGRNDPPPPIPVVAPAPVAPEPPPVAQPAPVADDKQAVVPAAPDKPLVAAAPVPVPDRAAQRSARGRCENTCQHANDGECDDGRPNAHTSLCALGTDCADCGAVGARFRRSTGPAAGTCTNTCEHANDNECDDGRPNSHTNACAPGTDCADCGPWGRAFRQRAGGCTNTCQHANDGECDDGRPGSDTDLCARGTDCADCGPA